jgi:hypothetical protein
MRAAEDCTAAKRVERRLVQEIGVNLNGVSLISQTGERFSTIEDNKASLVNNRCQDTDQNHGCAFDPLRAGHSFCKKHGKQDKSGGIKGPKDEAPEGG